MKKKISVFQIVISVILALVLLLGGAILFINPDPKPVKKSVIVAEKTETQSKPVFRKDGELSFVKKGKGELISKINIEVADDEPERERGLMYRESMAENEGMLFMMMVEETQSFWMKNTIIPLDILYVNAEREIVSIHKNTTPRSLDQIISAKPASFVVEVNAGYTDKYGIETGDRILF